MNFFEHQDVARRQTRRMLVLFAIAVVAIVMAVDGVVALAFGIGRDGGSGGGWGALAAISALVVVVIAGGSLYRIASLRGGGSSVALALGAVPATGDAGSFAYRRLRNVVEEMAIAAGVPVPQVFVLENESAINAFASGYAPTDAAITVTRGALDKLTREQLQGVIGHEFSHVLNGDMRLNIHLMGIVFGLLIVSISGRKIAEVSGRGRDSAGPVVFGLALFAVGYIGVVCGRLIKASISRQREFLADASAVQFTRQTEGIAGALKKIGGLAEGSKLANADTEEVAHMLFGDGVGYSALFATHPALEQRILRLDPSFRAEEFDAIAAAWSAPAQVGEDADDSQVTSIAGFAPLEAVAPHDRGAGMHLPPAAATMVLTPCGVVEQVGQPGGDDRAAARVIRTSIPLGLREAARQPERAEALVFAVLLSGEAEVSRRQSAVIEADHDAGTRVLVESLSTQVARLHPLQRLPLCALAFPTLRRRPLARLAMFTRTLRSLIDADDRVTLSEYCLARLIGVQVMDALNPAASLRIGRVKLAGVAREIKDILAILARHGHDDETSARRAYVLGLHEVLPDATAVYAPVPDWAGAIDRALPALDGLAPAGKELVVGALTRAISADGVVSVAEAELLRVVCATLHCPLPPLLQATD